MNVLLHNVSKSYSAGRAIHAVSNVSLDIDCGSFVAIVGSSGSGKTTLLNVIGGLVKPAIGKVVVDDVDISQLNADRRASFRKSKIGFVHQSANLLPALPAIDNVALPALLAGNINGRMSYARARMLLMRLGMADKANWYPRQLSPGEQRRVAIARALINEPSLLLADEPTADLDEISAREIVDLLLEVKQLYGLTVIIATHNKDVARRADRTIEMWNGTAQPVTLPKAAKITGNVLQVALHGAVPENGEGEFVAVSASDFWEDCKGPLRGCSARDIFELPPESTRSEIVALGADAQRIFVCFVLLALIVAVVCWLSCPDSVAFGTLLAR